MRLIVDLDDNDEEIEFVKGTRAVHGNIRLRCRGEEREAHIVAVAEPVCVAGTGHAMRAMYDVTPLSEL